MTKILLTLFLTTVILNTIVAEIKKYKPVHNCPEIPSNGQKYVSPINTNTNEKLDLHYQDCVLCPSDVKECYIRPLFTPQETGLEKSNYGNFEQYLNKPIKNGIFYFHAYNDSDKHAYGGECGLGVRYAMHAAVGGAFFSGATKNWPRSELNDLSYHSIHDEKVCIDICVKIEYDNKILTIPVMDETDYLHVNELDLSEEAFNWLKPDTWAPPKPATITYLKCPK